MYIAVFAFLPSTVENRGYKLMKYLFLEYFSFDMSGSFDFYEMILGF